MFKIFLILYSLIQLSNQLHFILKEGKERCFIDDIHDDAQVNIHYHYKEQFKSLKDNELEQGVKISIYDKEKNKIFDKLAIYNKGIKEKTMYHIKEGGQYKFCVKSTTSGNWISGSSQHIKFGLKIKVGEDTEENQNQNHEQGESQITLNQIKHQTFEFIKFQDYVRKQEDLFMEDNIFIDVTIAKMTLLYTAAIVITGLIQIISLRKFFRARKML